MSSDGELCADRAGESLQAGDVRQAQVWVLLGIRSELRTANLLAFAASMPTWGRPSVLPPEVRRLVEQIRAELDMPTEEPTP